MDGDYLSTGQAARLCAVTADTVLKWIKSGKLQAIRTPGGHYRIDRRDLDELRRKKGKPRVRYCWEYNADGPEPNEACEACVVYKARALRCYELVGSPGHSGRFCEGSCDDCPYFQIVQGQTSNVVVFAREGSAADLLKRTALSPPFNLEIVESIYELSALVERFPPDYVVIDTADDMERARQVAQHLQGDKRLRLIRIVLATDQDGSELVCEGGIFAQMRSPITLERIERCLKQVRESIVRRKESGP